MGLEIFFGNECSKRSMSQQVNVFGVTKSAFPTPLLGAHPSRSKPLLLVGATSGLEGNWFCNPFHLAKLAGRCSCTIRTESRIIVLNKSASLKES